MNKYMDILLRIIQVLTELDLVIYVYIILGLVGILIVYFLFKDYIQSELNKREYTISRARKDYLLLAVQYIENSNKSYMKSLNEIIDFLGKKISMLNSLSLSANKKNAIILLLIFSIVLIGLFIVLTLYQLTWYNIVLSILFEALIAFLGMYLLISISKASLLKQLPDAYKIIIMNMKKQMDTIDIIKESLLEMKNSSLKRELKRLANSLEKNDPYELAITFKTIEENYNVQYLTILLVVIKHISIHGGVLTARRELSYVQLKMRKEIQYQLDVAIATRIFMVLILIVNSAGLAFAHKLPGALLEDAASIIETDPNGIRIPLMIMTVVILLINLGLQKAAD